MTPEQLIKKQILLEAITNNDIEVKGKITTENIDTLYEKLLVEEDLHWDYESEFREGQFETNIESEWSRHYESKSVATQVVDGRWIGWTYWYGGGKHAEPEAIEWMGDAYFLECKEKEELVVTRTFKKIEKP